MKLIRIEHPKTGKGIYSSVDRRSRRLTDAIFDNFLRGDKHPEPENDSKLWPQIESKYNVSGAWEATFLLYGFASIEQLRAWFYGDSVLFLMAGDGFEIVEIEGDVTDGHTQATIDSHSITSKKSFNLLDYLGLIG